MNAVAMVVGSTGFFGLLAYACASLPSPSQQAVIAGYEAEQLACVMEAGTKLDADRCRCAVHQKYGGGCANFDLSGPQPEGGHDDAGRD